MKKSLFVFVYLLILTVPMISLFSINVVLTSPAYEDYTTFTESGSGDDGLIVVDSSTQVTFLLPWYKDRKLYKDYGTSYFGSSFTHFVDITPYAGGDPGDWQSFWAVTNTISHRDGLSACLYLGLYDWTSSGYRRMFLSSGGGSQSTKDYLSSGTTYYMKITRSGSSLQAKAYGSASNRLTDTSPLFTLSVTIASPSNVNYRYLWAVFPLGGNSGEGTPRHIVRNLEQRPAVESFVRTWQIMDYNDDCEALETRFHGEVWMVFGHYYTLPPSRIFVRFSIDIPEGSRIEEAHLILEARDTRSDEFTAKIRLLDYDSCPAFTSNPYYWPTVGEANWSVGPWTDGVEYGETNQPNEIETLVQNFVDRAGYEEGNYIGLRLDEGNSGTNIFHATHQRENGWGYAKLKVRWSPIGHAITVLSPQNKAYAATSVPLIFTVNETASWIGYSLDDQANVTVTGNTTLVGLLEGAHNVVVYANNTAGTMWASNTVYFTVDTTSPTVFLLSPENTTYTSASVPLSFTVNEPTSWIGYSLDDEANVTIAGNTTLSGLTEGAHSVVVYVTDTAGNMGVSSKVFFTVELPVSGSCTISLEPSRTMVMIGQTVSVTVTITNITDCVGYQLWIDYNATVLEYVGYTFDTDPANPMSPTQMAPSASQRVDTDLSVPGSVKLAIIWKAGVPAYSGSGVAAELTFQALTAGNSTIVFDQYWTRAIDSNVDDILFTEFNDTFIAVVMVMQSIGVESSMAIVQSGQTITVTVTITDITDCAGYQFWIDYDSTILEFVGYTFDTGTPLTPSQMAPSASQRVDTNASVAGSVKLATVWKAGVPVYSGSGVAAELTFQALAAGNSTLVFDQFWTMAVNSVGEEVLFGGFDDGWVVVTVQGDVDGDRDVDVGDQRLLQLAMFSYPGHPDWNPNADVDSDQDVDVGDQRIQQLHMFESW